LNAPQRPDVIGMPADRARKELRGLDVEWDEVVLRQPDERCPAAGRLRVAQTRWDAGRFLLVLTRQAGGG